MPFQNQYVVRSTAKPTDMSILKEIEELAYRREYDFGNGPSVILLGSMSWMKFVQELKERMEQQPILPAEDQGYWIAGTEVLQLPFHSSGILITTKSEANRLFMMLAQKHVSAPDIRDMPLKLDEEREERMSELFKNLEQLVKTVEHIPGPPKESRKKLRKEIQRLQNRLNEVQADLQMILDEKPGAIEMVKAKRAWIANLSSRTWFGSPTKSTDSPGPVYSGIQQEPTRYCTKCKACGEPNFHTDLKNLPKCTRCEAQLE